MEAELMKRDEWIAAFCEQTGLSPPSKDEVDALLQLAATAAHASHRTAAPLACWLGGRSGMSLENLNSVAERIAPKA